MWREAYYTHDILPPSLSLSLSLPSPPHCLTATDLQRTCVTSLAQSNMAQEAGR